MPSLQHLVSGFKTFRATIFPLKKDMVTHAMRQGIKPTTLCITCCDLKISPETLTSCNPGELYTVRNLGGFVPPYSTATAGGVVSAIEYAVSELKVENIIIMGHDHCDGIHSLITYRKKTDQELDPMGGWLNVMKDAKEAVLSQLANKTGEEKEEALEQETVLVSLKNILTYPWVADGLKEDKLSVYGMHFDIATGALRCFNPATRAFEPLG